MRILKIRDKMKTQTTIKLKITIKELDPNSEYYRVCPFSECSKPFMASRTDQEYCCKEHYDTDYNWHYRRKPLIKLESSSLNKRKRRVSDCGRYIYAPSSKAKTEARIIKVAYYMRRISRSINKITNLIQ